MFLIDLIENGYQSLGCRRQSPFTAARPCGIIGLAEDHKTSERKGRTSLKDTSQTHPNAVLDAGLQADTPKQRVVIVDPHRLLRDLLNHALELVPDLETAAQLDSIDELRDRLDELAPDAVVITATSGALDETFAFIRAVNHSRPQIKFMLLSRQHDTTLVPEAIEAGVCAFFFAEHMGLPGLITAIRSMRMGYRTFPDEETLRRIDPWHGIFTSREIRLLSLICENLERGEIAKALHVSESTVKHDVSALLEKTGFKSVQGLAMHLLARGFLVPRGIGRGEPETVLPAAERQK